MVCYIIVIIHKHDSVTFIWNWDQSFFFLLVILLALSFIYNE